MESCNCNLKKEENNDFHLVTVSQKNASEDSSVTAEITPRISLTVGLFLNLPTSRTKRLRQITGFLMLDTQHLGGGGPARIPDWEIHPVTSMQVYTGIVMACMFSVNCFFCFPSAVGTVEKRGLFFHGFH
jgi:hypothetical protein